MHEVNQMADCIYRPIVLLLFCHSMLSVWAAPNGGHVLKASGLKFWQKAVRLAFDTLMLCPCIGRIVLHHNLELAKVKPLIASKHLKSEACKRPWVWMSMLTLAWSIGLRTAFLYIAPFQFIGDTIEQPASMIVHTHFVLVFNERCPWSAGGRGSKAPISQVQASKKLNRTKLISLRAKEQGGSLHSLSISLTETHRRSKWAANVQADCQNCKHSLFVALSDVWISLHIVSDPKTRRACTSQGRKYCRDGCNLPFCVQSFRSGNRKLWGYHNQWYK